MSTFLTPLAEWVRRQPLLRGAAHRAVRLIPDLPRTANVRDLGPLRIRLRRHRWVYWSDFLAGDAFTFGVFERLIKPGDVVYDIGANIGLYARIMRQWFGAGRIVCFEPMRENYELLLRNIELGGMKVVVETHPIALSDADGSEELQVDDMTSGTAVLSSVSGGEASVGRKEFGLPPKSETVQVITLDHFMERQNPPPPPRMMKIDTEGAEVKVLAGARRTLRKHRPRLAIALHSTEKTLGTLQLLEESGYAAYGLVVEPDSKLGDAAWRRIRPVDAALLANNNIVASCDENELRAEIVPRTGPR